MHPETPPPVSRTRLNIVVCLLIAAAFFPGLLCAMGSSPILSITGTSAVATTSAVRSVSITGTFNFDDLLQFSFPAGLIVTQGDQFVRYDLSGQMVAGTSTHIDDAGMPRMTAAADRVLGDPPRQSQRPDVPVQGSEHARRHPPQPAQPASA